MRSTTAVDSLACPNPSPKAPVSHRYGATARLASAEFSVLTHQLVAKSRTFGVATSQADASALRNYARSVPAADLQCNFDAQSAFLQGAFRRSGGVATCDEIALFLRSHCDLPLSMLTRWIVRRQVVSYVWRSTTLLPLFQFDLERRSVRNGLPETIAELTDAFDDLEIALWFATPNCWLSNAAPADVVGVDLQSVIHAARTARFIALGG